MSTLGQLLHELRQRRGETQPHFAALTNVKPSTVSMRENDKVAVPSDELEQLAKAIGRRLAVGPNGWEALPILDPPENPLRDERLSPSDRRLSALPVVGEASAGDGGCFIDDGGVAWFSVEEAVRRQLDGLVYVRGNSMTPMLDDGDLVGLRRVDEVADGDVVVVQDMRADVLHIKVWQDPDEGDTVHLRSINPEHRTLILKSNDVQVLGVAYGLLRLRKLRVR